MDYSGYLCFILIIKPILMSYEIVYDKQFIKLPGDKYIPMLYWGSNNCTEATYNGKERRARDWSVWSYPCGPGKQWSTKEALLSYADNFRAECIARCDETDRYSDKNFGYWSSIALGGSSTHRTTFGQFRGLFNTGCNKALTVEELAEDGIDVCLSSYVWKKETYKELDIPELSMTVYTGEVLVDMVERYTNLYEGTPISLHITLRGATETTMKWLRRKRFPRAKKVVKELENVTEFWTVTVNDYYFVRKTKNGYQYAGYPRLKYKTEKEAKRRISKYKNSDFATYGIEHVKENAFI